MGKFIELSHPQVLELTRNFLVKSLPKSALLYNVALLSLHTKIHDIIPTKFYAYDGRIDGDDTFILSTQNKHKYHSSMTWTICGPDAINLKSEMFDALEDLVDWTSLNSFTAIHVDIRSEVIALCKKHGVHKEYGPMSVYWGQNDSKTVDELNLNSRLNDNISVVKLDADGVRKLVEHWEYAEESFFNEIMGITKIVGNAGVKIGNELVAWAFADTDGAIHGLYTLENHRGKGYSKIVLHSLWKMLASRGMHAITEVEDKNVPSAKLMLSCGLKFSHAMYWTEFAPNK